MRISCSSGAYRLGEKSVSASTNTQPNLNNAAAAESEIAADSVRNDRLQAPH